MILHDPVPYAPNLIVFYCLHPLFGCRSLRDVIVPRRRLRLLADLHPDRHRHGEVLHHQEPALVQPGGEVGRAEDIERLDVFVSPRRTEQRRSKVVSEKNLKKTLKFTQVKFTEVVRVIRIVVKNQIKTVKKHKSFFKIVY